MDDITREKLKRAFEPMFGPHFVDGLEALLPILQAERNAPYLRSSEKYEPLTPLIDDNGVEITLRLRRDPNGVYYVTASESYMSREQTLGPLHINTQAMSAVEAIIRMAPQLGEAISMAESIHECGQLNQRHSHNGPEP